MKMTDELNFEDRLRRAINLITWEKWEGKSTDEIIAIFNENLGEPERLNLLDGEVVSAHVVSRSKP